MAAVASGLPCRVVVWLAILRPAGMSLRNRSLNMFTLVAMGTGVAWVYSVIATVFPSWFPASFRNMDGLVAVYFEAAAVITVLVLLGQVLELRAREQTSGAITALLNLAPKTARRLDHDGHETDINAEDVLPGDKLRIRPGESIPVDGIVVEGKTTVDESMVTGESMPVTKTEGDPVIGGPLIRQVVLSSVQRKSVMKRCSHELFRWSLMHSVRGPHPENG